LVIVLDNLSIHTTPAVRAWLSAQDDRVRFEFLPLHASWLNQVETWFSILERQALARASDAIHKARAARIGRFVRPYEQGLQTLLKCESSNLFDRANDSR
jgi:transposase